MAWASTLAWLGEAAHSGIAVLGGRLEPGTTQSIRFNLGERLTYYLRCAFERNSTAQQDFIAE